MMDKINNVEKELNNTIESIYSQSKVEQHTKILTIICDGKIDRKIDKNKRLNDNSNIDKRTDEILIDIIFKDYITETHILKNAYKIWTNEWNDIEIHIGKYTSAETNKLYKQLSELIESGDEPAYNKFYATLR